MVIPKNDLVEFFLSWQGEGVYTGSRAFFIRFKKCNLKCPFCDTMQAMIHKTSYVDLTESEIENLSDQSQITVLTGGEPTLYENHIKNIASIVTTKPIVIETNGLKFDVIDMLYKTYNNIEFSISPKLLNEKLLSTYLSIYETSEMNKLPLIFKIVIGDRTKRERTFIEKLLEAGVDGFKIFLMPESRSATEILLRTPKVFDLASQYNVNVTTRLQIMGLVP